MAAGTAVAQRATRVHSSNRYRARRRLLVLGAHAILIAVVIVSVYPFVVLALDSFKSDSGITANPAGWPRPWTLVSYRELFQFNGGAWRNFVNSVVITGSSTILSVAFAGMAAFAFAKYHFRGRNLIFALLLATLIVPSEVTIPPLYIMFAKIHWLNTLQVQIVPTVADVFGLFLIRQYMLTVPNELLDAARIDGAGHWKVFWQIMVPVSAPILGAFAILHFLGVWNSYLWPLVVANDVAVQPIMVVLPNLTDPFVGFLPAWGEIMAGIVLATLPVMAFFIAFQDKFMSSVVIGAVKE